MPDPRSSNKCQAEQGFETGSSWSQSHTLATRSCWLFQGSPCDVNLVTRAFRGAANSPNNQAKVHIESICHPNITWVSLWWNYLCQRVLALHSSQYISDLYKALGVLGFPKVLIAKSGTNQQPQFGGGVQFPNLTIETQSFPQLKPDWTETRLVFVTTSYQRKQSIQANRFYRLCNNVSQQKMKQFGVCICILLTRTVGDQHPSRILMKSTSGRNWLAGQALLSLPLHYFRAGLVMIMAYGTLQDRLDKV